MTDLFIVLITFSISEKKVSFDSDRTALDPLKWWGTNN